MSPPWRPREKSLVWNSVGQMNSHTVIPCTAAVLFVVTGRCMRGRSFFPQDSQIPGWWSWSWFISSEAPHKTGHEKGRNPEMDGLEDAFPFQKKWFSTSLLWWLSGRSHNPSEMFTFRLRPQNLEKNETMNCHTKDLTACTLVYPFRYQLCCCCKTCVFL